MLVGSHRLGKHKRPIEKGDQIVISGLPQWKQSFLDMSDTGERINELARNNCENSKDNVLFPSQKLLS